MKKILYLPKFLLVFVIYCAAPLTPPAIPALARVVAIDGVPVAGSIPLFAVAFGEVELPQGEGVEWHFGWGLGGGMD